MGLSTFTPKVEAVELPDDGVLVVRGLSLQDFTVLLADHYEVANTLFDRYVVAAGLLDPDGPPPDADAPSPEMKQVVMAAAKEAPALIADIIAYAADEPAHRDRARALPMGVQIEAFSKVFALTVQAEGGLEKLIETVTTAWMSMAGLIKEPSR